MESAKPSVEERPTRQQPTVDDGQQRHAEKALAASEEKHRTIIESIPVGMHMYRLEDDGSLVFFDSNPAAGRILGVDHKQFVGLTIEEAFPALAETEVPEQYRRVAETGETWRNDEIIYREGQIAGAFEVHAFQSSPGRMVAAFFDITDRKRAERRLQESEATLRSIFRVAPVGIGLVSDGVLSQVNQRVCEMVGYTREELLGQGEQVLFPDSHEFERAGREKADQIAERGTGTVETRWRRKQGGEIDVLLSSTPLDQKDVTAGITFSALDITERKQTMDALRRRTNQLEALRQVGLELTTELNLEALLRSIASRSVGLLECSAGSLYLLRSSPELLELVVAVGMDQMHVGTTLLRGEGLAGKILETGEPLMVNNYRQWDGRAAVYEGTAFAAVLGVPICWGEESLGVLDVVADAPRVFSPADTELLSLFATQVAIAIQNARLFQAEQQRRREAEALRQMSLVLGAYLDRDQVLDRLLQQIETVIPYDSANVMQIEDGIARITHQRGYERTGTAEATAALRLEVDNVPNLRWMLKERRPHIVSDTWTDPEWVRFEPTGWIRSWAGAPIVVRNEVVAFFSMDSQTPEFYTAEHADLLVAFAAHAAIAFENAMLYTEVQTAYEEQKRTQAQLIQSAKLAAVGELAAGVAHEINNPLTSVLGFSELLLRNTALDEATRADLTIIVEEARRARDIVRGLLEFSRQSESSFDRIDVNRVLCDTVDLLRRQIEDRKVVVEECYGQGIPLLPLDVGRMKQVFLNLIANALKAMPDGGTLDLSSQMIGDGVAIYISDTGLGISDDILPRIFEPFFTTWPVGQGTGLGLSVSLGIVQEHGGRITVESRVGEGSTFTVWLPIESATMEENHGG